MRGELTSEAMATYREGARPRLAERARAIDERRERAWSVARRAADLLCSRFGAQRVLLFGSLAHPARFHARSDVDLAAWGLREDEYLRAVSALLSLDPDIPVDLIEAERTSSTLLATITRDGMPL